MGKFAQEGAWFIVFLSERDIFDKNAINPSRSPFVKTPVLKVEL